MSAAVAYSVDTVIPGCRDSKKLTPKKRKEVAAHAETHLPCGLGVSTVEEIDELNILQASLLSMKRAVDDLFLKLDQGEAVGRRTKSLVLVDGNQLIPDLDSGVLQMTCVGGDSLVEPIAAASVVAKVFRDNLMTELDRAYPGYNFLKNKGYGTGDHIEGLKTRGVSPVHRRSFRPCSEMF